MQQRVLQRLLSRHEGGGDKTPTVSEILRCSFDRLTAEHK